MSVNINMDINENENPIYEEDFVFPHKLVDQISECSPEGFMLFTIDERGDVQVHSKFSADILEAGLRYKALKMLKTLDAVDDNEMTQIIMKQRHPEIEESDGFEEEGDDDGESSF